MYYFTDDTIINSKLSNTYLYTKFNCNIDYLEYVPTTTTETNNINSDDFEFDINNFQNQQNQDHYLKNNQNLLLFIKYLKSNPDYKFNNYFYYKRLKNICWRRIYQNHKDLQFLNPLIINWDKNSDITWLYGPKIESSLSSLINLSHQNEIMIEKDEVEVEVEEEEEIDNHTITDENINKFNNNAINIDNTTNKNNKDDDDISVSSLDSDSTITSNYSLNSSSRKSSTTSNLSSSYYEEDLKQSQQQQQQQPPPRSCLKGSPKLTSTSTFQQPQQQQSRKVSFNYIINMREIIDNISLDYNFLDRNCV
ncbi:hypothetical protein KGF54_003401 [Candida jiufengensis]|uniref:uncharacterized protein n=1 Tax=Candida jiufengensis TaxID=497108 RepID=UPI002224F5BE|nr:uncharacterized protein KGF54_003401 [Candida jiufengensis]KAI5952534.1 hypothetical protein KGF54_003401 [Candida jiufengensis]